MLSQGKKEISDRVSREVEKLEAMDSIEEFPEPLEVKFEANMRGNVSEITLITQTGGPQIEINLFSSSVTGFNSESSTQKFFNIELRGELIEKYGSRINETTVKA